jgi:hypothetical protein
MTSAEILAILLREGYPLATIAKHSGVKECLLASLELTDRDQARLEHYASEQPCLRNLIGDTE